MSPPGDFEGPGGPRTGVMPTAEVVAMRHGDLDDAPLRSRYSLEGKLGRGGMGVVVEALDRRIGRRVAVKRLAGTPTAAMVDRFVREARVQGRLDHPAVVPVYDLGIQSDGRPYFAMRKLSGVTLAEVLRRHNGDDAEAIAAYPRRRLLEALVAVCLAIEYAHTRGVIHRDLKPANIGLGEFGEVYVLDWGVALVAGEAQPPAAPGETAGTVGYMSPEQASGDADLDPRVDVYGLGCILFEILAGSSLQRDAAAGPIDPRPSVRAPEREVPGDLDLVCARAAAPARRDRFASARALADAIERHLDADRDAAVQIERAADYAARARAAVDRGDGEVERATAMREAGRALALDPGNPMAAAVVRELLLEPPAHPPAAVAAQQAAADEATMRAQARTSALSYAMMAGFVPLFIAQGLRNWWYAPALLAMISVLAVLSFLAARGRLTRGHVWIAVGGNAVMLLMLSRVLGPFMVPPGLAVMVAMGVMTRPTIAQWGLVTMLLGATPLLAWGLEEAGVLGATIAADGDRLELGSTVIELPAAMVAGGLVMFVVSLQVVAVAFARKVTTVHHATRRTLAVRAWHLSRLLGDVDTDRQGKP